MCVHPKLARFDAELENLFREVDEILEEHWGNSFPLHPNRAGKGSTSNPVMDGLFEIAPDFTLGLNSEKGRGYLITLRVATLEKVPPDEYEKFLEESAVLIRKKLVEYFPGRDLRVVRDGPRYKIAGDFSLGDV